MNENLIEIIVGAICALIGTIVGFISSWFLLKFNYKKMFAETVSKNRMEWINVWRENISKFLACSEILINFDSFDNKYEYIKEFYESRAMIVSRLNMNEELHKLMYIQINSINYAKKDNDFFKKRESILELERNILKIEWERVKSEAKGKR